NRVVYSEKNPSLWHRSLLRLCLCVAGGHRRLRVTLEDKIISQHDQQHHGNHVQAVHLIRGHVARRRTQIAQPLAGDYLLDPEDGPIERRLRLRSEANRQLFGTCSITTNENKRCERDRWSRPGSFRSSSHLLPGLIQEFIHRLFQGFRVQFGRRYADSDAGYLHAAHVRELICEEWHPNDGNSIPSGLLQAEQPSVAHQELRAAIGQHCRLRYPRGHQHIRRHRHLFSVRVLPDKAVLGRTAEQLQQLTVHFRSEHFALHVCAEAEHDHAPAGARHELFHHLWQGKGAAQCIDGSKILHTFFLLPKRRENYRRYFFGSFYMQSAHLHHVRRKELIEVKRMIAVHQHQLRASFQQLHMRQISALEDALHALVLVRHVNLLPVEHIERPVERVLHPLDERHLRAEAGRRVWHVRWVERNVR
uniref:Uncharacterized protein n=1 Tax=Anopheles atroparvus TaxID=41427 RepID=A0AAG5CSA8_ANOAO